jgi:hypothetical protein
MAMETVEKGIAHVLEYLRDVGHTLWLLVTNPRTGAERLARGAPPAPAPLATLLLLAFGIAVLAYPLIWSGQLWLGGDVLNVVKDRLVRRPDFSQMLSAAAPVFLLAVALSAGLSKLALHSEPSLNRDDIGRAARYSIALFYLIGSLSIVFDAVAKTVWPRGSSPVLRFIEWSAPIVSPLAAGLTIFLPAALGYLALGAIASAVPRARRALWVGIALAATLSSHVVLINAVNVGITLWNDLFPPPVVKQPANVGAIISEYRLAASARSFRPGIADTMDAMAFVTLVVENPTDNPIYLSLEAPMHAWWQIGTANVAKTRLTPQRWSKGDVRFAKLQSGETLEIETSARWIANCYRCVPADSLPVEAMERGGTFTVAIPVSRKFGMPTNEVVTTDPVTIGKARDRTRSDQR